MKPPSELNLVNFITSKEINSMLGTSGGFLKNLVLKSSI